MRHLSILGPCEVSLSRASPLLLLNTLIICSGMSGKTHPRLEEGLGTHTVLCLDEMSQVSHYFGLYCRSFQVELCDQGCVPALCLTAVT